jgi:glycosyltransferase involved in cell wall biosynthesis
MVRTKVILVTDAWLPQVNGVVTTYSNIQRHLPMGVEMDVIEPSQFANWPLPFYKGINVPWCTKGIMTKLLTQRTRLYQLQGFQVRYHIATEGVLGWCARQVLNKHKIPFTTAYHTKFPEFFQAMFGIPVRYTRWYFDWFHAASQLVMCSSESNRAENPSWTSAVLRKGVDPRFTVKKNKGNPAHPMLLYVGRVSQEKNIEDFCDLDIANSQKVVVGDGPYLNTLRNRYPEVEFVGYKFGDDLVRYYQAADVLVFPSRADTFGIVILEAMSCGTPCAAYPVTGARDQIRNGINGFTDEDLELAVELCLDLDPTVIRATVEGETWVRSAQQFVEHLESLDHKALFLPNAAPL